MFHDLVTNFVPVSVRIRDTFANDIHYATTIDKLSDILSDDLDCFINRNEREEFRLKFIKQYNDLVATNAKSVTFGIGDSIELHNANLNTVYTITKI